jgi:uncharacterized ion transporter superfamily protein YfcC
MSIKRAFPAPLTVLMIIIALAAIATWLLPAGQYNKLSIKEGRFFTVQSVAGEVQLPFAQKTLDSLGIRINFESFKNGDILKPVSIPGTYHKLPKNQQGPLDILEAPLKGILGAIDIILIILMIGGFIGIFYQSGAIEKGLIYVSAKMKGRETWLIIILTFLFVLGGSTFGMDEETLAFYPLLVPVFLLAGYDLLVPVAVIFMGTRIGHLSLITNPFSTIIASDSAGVNWINGLYGRTLMLLVSSVITIWYIIKYAQKIKMDPSASIVRRYDGSVQSSFAAITSMGNVTKVERKTVWILLLFMFTFLTMVFGVAFFDWWALEMSALFLGSSLILGFIMRMKEKLFIEKFLKGAESLLGVSFVVGFARGVSIILNEGRISDTILFYSAQLTGNLPPALFIVILMLLYMLFTLFIASHTGMAVLTMPVMGSLGVVTDVPVEEVVNAYLYGMGIMTLITPVGLILPSLAIVNVSYKAGLKFVFPLMLVLTVICALFLIVGVLW